MWCQTSEMSSLDQLFHLSFYGQLSRLSLLGQLAYFVVAGGNVQYCLRSVDPGNLASHRLFESYNFTGEITSQGRSI